MNAVKTLVILAVGVVLGVAGVVGVQHTVAPKAGSLSGPDIASQYLNWGGIAEWHFKADVKTGSSTLCAIQSPNATTTLNLPEVALRLDSTPAYTTIYEIGWGAAMNATTTALLASYTVASGAKATLVATTTLLTDNVVAPNTWLNFNLSTSTATGASAATGSCQAGFNQI